MTKRLFVMIIALLFALLAFSLVGLFALTKTTHATLPFPTVTLTLPIPTDTPILPTDTPIPPTDTPVPPTPTNTPVPPTPKPKPTPTPTPKDKPTPTPTPTDTPTPTPTDTPTPIPTDTPTPMDTPTPTVTLTSTPTVTPAPGSQKPAQGVLWPTPTRGSTTPRGPRESGTPGSTGGMSGGGASVYGVPLPNLSNGMLMTVLVGATVLIIIAVAVFLFALRVLRRQVGQQRAMTGEPIGELMAVPAQEFFANQPGTLHSLTFDGVQYSSGSGLADLDREGQWTQTAHQFGPNQDNLVDYGAMVFATEPVPTEQMPQQATPRAPQLPSTPVPQQQQIPSTPTTPTDLWEMSAGEVVTDPVLETMMHEAQAGLYVIPEREDRLEA